MAKFVRQRSDIAMALDRLQGFAENVISLETNRRVQLGREKEARVVDALNYMLQDEEQEIAELETVLDGIVNNLEARGLEGIKLADQHKTIAFDELLNAAAEGATELTTVKLEDRKRSKESLEKRIREANKIKRTINIYDDALGLIGPSYAGDKKIIEADDVAAVYDKLYAGADDIFKQELEDTKAYIKQREEYVQRPEGIEALREMYKGDHVSAIQSYDIPRQHTVDILKMHTQDPAMVLARHFSPIGVLQSQLAEETVPNKQEALKAEIQAELADLGSLLYPQIKDYEGNWITPTPELSANMAQELRTSLALLQEGDPTEFVAYLENVQLYYDEMKKDGTEQGKLVSDRVRSEVLNLLGIDLEAPVKFGEEYMTQIELILLEYKELERIDLEQFFHGTMVTGNIPSNVTFDALEPDNTSSKADIFGKAKLKNE